jgi:hypothetical protein
MAEELRAHTACTPKEGTKDRSAAGYGAEKKMDGISRLSRGSWVPRRYLDPPPPVTLRFASAGAFLASSQLLVRARWLWWNREKRLDLDSTTPSVLSRGVVVVGAGPIGRDCGCCIFWSGRVDMDVWARFYNAVGRGKGLKEKSGTRERSHDLRWRRARPCSGP